MSPWLVGLGDHPVYLTLNKLSYLSYLILPAGKNRRNGGLKPFKDLHVEGLKRECTARGLPCDGSKTELQEILKEEIGGIQRVPAMILFGQEKTMADLGLG